MPRRKQKVKYLRKIACKHLEPVGDISSSLQPLCFCPERYLVLGTKAYVCQVCTLYTAEASVKISEVYEESKNIAEKKIKEKKLELVDYEIEEIEKDEELDLSIDEFEEDEEEIPLKFEKRKVGKSDIEEGEDFAEVECPFCGEVYDDLASHIQNCEFAPDDASIKDVLPTKGRKKKKKRKPTQTIDSKPTTGQKAEEKSGQVCPHCGKSFIRLGRHLNSCKKKPKDTDADEE